MIASFSETLPGPEKPVHPAFSLQPRREAQALCQSFLISDSGRDVQIRELAS